MPFPNRAGRLPAQPFILPRASRPDPVVSENPPLRFAPTFSRHQADLLATHFNRVVLMLDGDEAGWQAVMSIIHILGVRMSVSAISLEEAVNPICCHHEKYAAS